VCALALPRLVLAGSSDSARRCSAMSARCRLR
jgi:hypothetical protein